MKTIDEYIELSKGMQNTSDGGSPSFDFGDAVLIKYTSPKKYNNIPRKNEENVAVIANKKNEQGVRTPKHLGIKRTEDEANLICWVLQEKAAGKCYERYRSKNPQEQIRLQKIILEAPDSHFDRCIMDLCEIFHMGLETKPKNVFYDESKENGGFTFIDLLDNDETPLNPDSIEDIIFLNKVYSFVFGSTTISSYDEKAGQEEKDISNSISIKIQEKLISAMERVIPNFQKHKRWLLRTYPASTLEIFKRDVFYTESLNLNEEEIQEFYERFEEFTNELIRKIESGKSKLWQIYANEIRNGLSDNGLEAAWFYHKSNKRMQSDYETIYDYEYDCKHDLQSMAKLLFEEKLNTLSQTSNNPNIQQAIADLKEREEERNMKK